MDFLAQYEKQRQGSSPYEEKVYVTDEQQQMSGIYKLVADWTGRLSGGRIQTPAQVQIVLIVIIIILIAASFYIYFGGSTARPTPTAKELELTPSSAGRAR